jgi:ankyrin repeat protein
LHWATGDDVIKYLASLGLDVNARDKRGWTPLHYAVDRQGCDDIKTLVSLGASMIVGDAHDKSPFHLAAEKGFIDVIRVLVSLGADVNAPKSGCTALYTAVEEKHVNAVRVLAQLGANVNSPTPNKISPLCQAALNKDMATIRVLIAYGADWYYESSDGNVFEIVGRHAGESGLRALQHCVTREVAMTLSPLELPICELCCDERS